MARKCQKTNKWQEPNKYFFLKKGRSLWEKFKRKTTATSKRIWQEKLATYLQVSVTDWVSWLDALKGPQALLLQFYIQLYVHIKNSSKVSSQFLKIELEDESEDEDELKDDESVVRLSSGFSITAALSSAWILSTAFRSPLRRRLILFFTSRFSSSYCWTKHLNWTINKSA